MSGLTVFMNNNWISGKCQKCHMECKINSIGYCTHCFNIICTNARNEIDVMHCFDCDKILSHADRTSSGYCKRCHKMRNVRRRMKEYIRGTV